MLGSEDTNYQIVVAALGKCSRPEKLKGFLYLDFINKARQSVVLDKLVQTIGTVSIGLACDHSEVIA